jgi:putative tryptophan/tyrosine transport system substrate-binding protein
MNRLSRRQLVQGAGAVGLGLLAGCKPFSGPARSPLREPDKPARIGFLGPPRSLGPFQDALRELGYVEGENLAIELRFAEGQADRMRAFARELVDLRVDAIVVASTSDARDARAATSTIPIVSAGVAGGDLVAEGLAASLARPGGNVTGLTTFEHELVGKRMQLLTEVMPGVSRVGVIWDGNEAGPLMRTRFERPAQELGVQLQVLELRTAQELDGAFEAIARESTQVLMLTSTAILIENRSRIVELALHYRLPTMANARLFVTAGGLMAYNLQPSDLWRRAATYVDKILKGAKAAELPVEGPTRFDFVINLKTAQALGITIPPHVLLQATEVIQ